MMETGEKYKVVIVDDEVQRLMLCAESWSPIVNLK